jgi:ATP-dependent helicase/nuclease subunit B
LLTGELIPGFPSADPLDLARATIYVPTRRAGAALARELVEASGFKALILPRIAPLGAFEPDLGEESEPDAADLVERPAVGELARRMALAALTRKWAEVLRGAIRRVGPDGRLVFDEGEPPLVVAGAAQAFALAGDLGALIDDMIIDDVAPERLKTLVADAYDPYWGVTLDFLKIAFEAWPNWLAERGLVDGARRTALLVDREIAALRRPDRGPVIIAGSTGANRATARLIAAIAHARHGAVVLPDLDKDLDAPSFALIGRDGEEAAGPIAGHPQTLLRRLLGVMAVERQDVRTLGAPTSALVQRARILSEALRPAETTELWPERRKTFGAANIAEGLADVSLIVAENETEEALALAIAMREALETPGRRAALITPDPSLARRVAAELARWDIEVENSAGRSLAQTPIGELARLALAAALDFAPKTLAALIERPQVTSARADFAQGARTLQLTALRSSLLLNGLDDVEQTFAVAREEARAQRAHPALTRLTDADLAAAREALAALIAALAPLRTLDSAPVAAFVAAHRAALSKLRAPEAWETDVEGQALAGLFDEWEAASEERFEVTLGDYAALFEAVAAAKRAPPPPGAHPRLAILGLLEARLLPFDLTLLAGLDESVWPPSPDTDAFLNRAMRAELGLSPPERRIGQTAHDFVSALGAAETILSRAKKRGSSPTVASRFLQRLGAFAGEAEMSAMERRGARYLDWARELDRAEPGKPIKRPEPKPDVALRPMRLSVTRIETLRRDPYAVYAEQILELIPLAEIGARLGPREIGTMWHAALQAFAEGSKSEESAEVKWARLLAEAERAFAPLTPDPAFAALHWPRIKTALQKFLDFDAERREEASRLFFELGGALEIEVPGAAAFTLTARADRIELLKGGGAAIIDYKTGTPPSDKEIVVGFAPQLTLEAAMLKRGAFKQVGPETAEALIHFKLGGAEGGKPKTFKPKDIAVAEVVEDHFARLKKLLADLANPDKGFMSKPFPKFVGLGSDYDHLARRSEWASVDGDEP